jgi:acetyl-CoA carboxylase biotin carboxylase subunit
MQKVLVANRGEIAVRIMKTLRNMGIKSVAIYSEADKNALHVRYADEAFYVGPAPSSQSYLNQDIILDIALKNKVDGIHPGYGFLSENPAFAKKVESSGIKLIGPSAKSMEIMGSKLGAKDAVRKFNIPMVPGTPDAISDPVKALEIAEKIGFPVLVKASAGGGGKGMRTVYDASELKDQIQLAINEATSAFGDGSVFLEKYIASPKHIEVQILADQHGNTVYLFERECSVQRRHQKVVEEAPSAILTPEIRKSIGEAAVNVAKSCHYEGAGTVEFLVDSQLNYYFLEMNTRLQVEHPVTECITGLDLVEQQVKIARGEALSFTQEDLKINGHAIELRVYAEDPEDNFMPSINQLSTYKIPSGNGIRVDNGIEEGMQVPIHYDPMLAKLVVHGTDRNDAIEKMKNAISQYHIEGIASTLNFGAFVMNHPDFISGNFDTHFVPKNWTNAEKERLFRKESALAAHIAKFIFEQDEKKLIVP